MNSEALTFRPDFRIFENNSDKSGSCRKCGVSLVMLPDDRRMGYCYDCFDLSVAPKRHDVRLVFG